MHLEVQKEQLEYLMRVIRVFKTKCKAKSTALYLAFKDDCSEFTYSSESFFVKLKLDYIAEFKGEYGLELDFVKNVLALFDDDLIEIDFQDALVVAHQEGTTLKGQATKSPKYDSLRIDENELREVFLEFDLSNKLLALDLEELGLNCKDPYAHLYNVSKDKIIKMSSFCALMQTLEKPTTQNVTLTQDVLSMCSIVGSDARFFKYLNSFYIRDINLEVKMPLANVRFPSLEPIIERIKVGGECFLVEAGVLLDICDKCCNLDLKKKINRVDVVLKNDLIMYSYNTILTGSSQLETTLEWKASFNPLLMRSLLKYIDEDYVTICKNNNANAILVYNENKSTIFMLALCK